MLVFAQLAKVMNSTKRNQIESPLLRLPGELRNRIHDYVHPTQMWTVPPLAFVLDNGKADASPPGLSKALLNTQVCRQIYAENALLPLMNSVFLVEKARWFLDLTSHQRNAITTIELPHFDIDISAGRPPRFSGTPVMNVVPRFTGVKDVWLKAVIRSFWNDANTHESAFNDHDLQNMAAALTGGLHVILRGARVTIVFVSKDTFRAIKSVL